jgi:hypothetical protein
MNWNVLSESFVVATKSMEDVQIYVDALKRADWNTLNRVMLNNKERLAFWINIYNAFIQIEAGKNEDELVKKRHRFFSQKCIQIGDQKLSFDDIEHVILRRNAFKYGLGYLRFPLFAGALKNAMLFDLDFRIHFALNCGAASCPAVGAYQPSRINEQLHSSSLGFLMQETAYSQKEKSVLVTRLMFWFHGDFGGSRGIRKILSHYGIIPPKSKPKILFTDYDWTLKLGNFMP